MKRKWILVGIAYVGLFLICVLAVYVFPQVRGMLVSTYITEQEELAITDKITGYIVRDEQVYVAASDCNVKKKAKSETLYAAGAQAVELTPASREESENDKQYRPVLSLLGKDVKETSDGVSPIAGYISYFVDGYEGRLTPDNIEDIKMSEYEKINTGLRTETSKGRALAGDPLFKVTRNEKWYIVFFVDIDEMYKYNAGSNVKVTIGDVTEKAYITEVTEGVHVARVVLKCGFAYKGYLEDRKIDAEVTTASAKGLKLENKSIIEKDGHKGVLVKDKVGNYHFKRISIKADDGKNCVVCQDLFMDEEGNFVETINIYDEIVKKPSKNEIKKAE